MEPPDERIVEQYLEAEQERNDNAFLGTVADLQRALDAEREKVKELEADLVHA